MKRLISMIVVLALCYSVTGTVLAWDWTQEREWIIGDASWDHKIDASDALLALQVAVTKLDLSGSDVVEMEKQSEVQDRPGFYESKLEVYHYHRIQLCGDVNGNNWVEAGDALMILQHAVGKREAFPRIDFTSDRCRVQKFPDR